MATDPATADRGGIDAVIFDLDGVLVDSEELWDEVRQGMAADAGLAWPAEATRAMQGMSTREWAHYLTASVGLPGSDDEVAQAVIDAMAARYEQSLPLIGGAVEAVERLAALWPLGLASSSPRRLIDAVLSESGLVSKFQLSVSTEEVSAGKPSPIVYETAMTRLGVEPSRAVAIEDSSNGLRSASAAGMHVVAIPHAAFPPAPEALALANVELGSLAGLTPDLIRSLST